MSANDRETDLFQEVDGKTCRLLPYTTAKQVALASGLDLETRLAQIGQASSGIPLDLAAPLFINADGALDISHGPGKTLADNSQLQALETAHTATAGAVENLSGSVDGLAAGQSQQTAQIASLLSFKEEAEEWIEDLEKWQTGAENRLDTLVDAYGEDHASLADLSSRYALDQLNNETRLTALENTASADNSGLMSASDKIKLDGIEAGAQVNPTLEELGGLSKSGGTMTGNMGIANDEPIFYLDNLNDVQKAAPLSGDASSMVRLRDKDKNTVAYLNYTHSADGSRKWLFQLIGQGTAGWRNLDYTVTPDGYATLSTPSHPNLSENGTVYVDAWWVNQKLGSGASVASLALLNETDAAPDPLEIARKEAIARVNADAQQAIYQGFPYELDGEEVLVPYSLFDQVNLNSLAIAAMSAPENSFPLSCKSMAGEDLLQDVSAQTIREVCAYGAINHRAAILRDVHEKKQRILAAMDEAEVAAIELD